MPLSHGCIHKTVETCLACHPDERPQLGGFLEALDRPEGTTSRSSFSAHVTCGAVVDQLGRRVLYVLHRASGRGLVPGGWAKSEGECLARAEPTS